MRRVWLALVIFVVAALWVIWASQVVIGRHLFWFWSIERAGQWGDTFGALNALFAAVGFIAILVTLSTQRQQLTDQQTQIRHDVTLRHKDRFETTFFELLKVLREEREQLRFRYSDDYLAAYVGTKTRSKVLKRGRNALRAAIYEAKFWISKSDTALTKERIEELYDKRVHSRYLSYFGPYYRIIYTILRRINDDTILSDDDKDAYGRIVRSQLTHFEATLAGINGLASFSKDFRLLIIRFRLLKYIPENRLKGTLRNFYPKETFEGRRGEIPLRLVDDDDRDDDDGDEDGQPKRGLE